MHNLSYYCYRRLDVGPQLELIYKDLLSNIHYVEIGLEHQNIRVEFERAGYCLLIRDVNLGRQLHAKLSRMWHDVSDNSVSVIHMYVLRFKVINSLSAIGL